MKSFTKHTAAALLRSILLLMAVVLPAAAYSAANVTVSYAVSPSGNYPVSGGYVILPDTQTYVISYGFNITTTKTPSSVTGSYTFGKNNGSISANVNNGSITVTTLRIRNVSAGEYKLTYTFNITYTDGTSETVSNTFSPGISIVTAASSSVERTELDAVLSGTTVTLGPIVLEGGNSNGWNVEWSAGSASGTNNTSCRYRSTATSYKVNEVTAIVTNTVNGSETYHEEYVFHIPTYPSTSASVRTAYPAVYSGNTMTFEVDPKGGYPEGWHYSWLYGISSADSRTVEYMVPSVQSESTATVRVQVTNLSPNGESWYNQNIGTNYTVYPEPQVNFTEVGSNIIEPTSQHILQADATGGQDGMWTYEWMVDGVRQNTSKNFAYFAPQTNSVIVQTVSVVATNSATGVAEPFKATKEYRFIIMPGGGSGSTETILKSTYSATPVTLEVPLGSVADGWNYRWTLTNTGETLPGNTNALEFSREVAETTLYNIQCEASTNVDGQSIAVTFSFEVTVYPTPSSEVKYTPDYETYIEGEEFTAELIGKGGDPNAWTYKWMEETGIKNDLQTVSEQSTYLVKVREFNGTFPDVDNDYKGYALGGLIKNSPANVIESYSYVDWKAIHVYQSPAVSIDGQSDYTVSSGSQVTFKLNASGGVGWTYFWAIDGNIQEGTSELSVNLKNTTNEVLTKEYKVSTQCWIPNYTERRIVHNEEFTFTVNVYPESIAQFVGDYPTAVETNTTVPIEVKTADDNASNWRFQWYVDDVLVSYVTGTSYNFSRTTPGTYQVKVVVTNREDPSISFEMLKDFVVYSTPSATIKGTDTFYALSGQAVTLELNAGGGGDWEFKWYDNEDKLLGTTVEPTFTVVPENTGDHVQTQTYKATATSKVNTAKGELTVYESGYINFNINVYPENTLTFIEEYPTDILVSTNVTLQVKTGDGNTDNWTFRWYVNDVLVPYETSISYFFNRTTPGDYTVKVEATNKANTSLSFEKTQDFHVYDNPSAVQKDKKFYVLAGTPVTMELDTIGGIPGQWEIVWTRDDREEARNQTSLTVTPEEQGTFYYHARVSSPWPLNPEDYHEDFLYQIEVYPKNTVYLDGDYPTELIVGESVTLKLAFDVYKADEWTITWKLNDVNTFNTGTEYEFTPSVAGTYQVQAEVVNRFNSNLKFNLGYSCTVYDYPSLPNEGSVAGFQLYSGESETFDIKTNGGYPDGWTWEILQNENPIEQGSGAEINYQFVAPVVNEAQTITLKFCFVNSYDPNRTFSLEKQMYVFPVPGAALNILSGSNMLGAGESVTYEVTTTADKDVNGTWAYYWTLDGNSLSLPTNAKTYTYTAPSVVNDKEEHTVSVLARLTAVKESMSRDLGPMEEKIEVWPDGVISSPEIQNVGTLPDTTFTIGVRVIGALDGWTFTWTRNGQAFENNSPTYGVRYAADAPRTSEQFTVHGVFRRNGEIAFDKTYYINVSLYDFAESAISDPVRHGYIGHTLVIYVKPSGGNPNGWRYEWLVFGNRYDTQEIAYTIPDYAAENVAYVGSVIAINESPDGTELYRKEHNFSTYAYTLGEASFSEPTYTDFAGQADRPYTVLFTGGYSEGWTFQWYGDGFNEMGKSDFIPPYENTGSSVETREFYVRVQNTLNGDIGYDNTFTGYVTLYPALNLPEAPTASARNIRQGESVTVSFDATGGYGDWSYLWFIDGSSYYRGSSRITYTPVPYTNSDKDIVSTTFSVEALNYGPQWQTWCDSMSGSVNVNSYAAPEAPSEVLIKGNGTSRTLIAMMNAGSDEVLADRGYQYVFGYTDGGTDFALNPTDVRYNHFTAEQFNNGNRDFWAYCRWIYDDGSIVTSGRRYLSGYLDSSFDASEFAGGRGDTSGIVWLETGTIDSNGYWFRATPASPSAAQVKIYSTSGQLVRVCDYPSQQSFDETVQLEGLATGMYLVDITVGQLRTVKKVVVENK